MTGVTAQLFNYSVSNHHVRMAATTEARRREQTDQQCHNQREVCVHEPRFMFFASQKLETSSTWHSGNGVVISKFLGMHRLHFFNRTWKNDFFFIFCLFIHQFIYSSIYRSIIHSSVTLSNPSYMQLSVYLTNHSSLTHPCIHPSVCPSDGPSFHLSIH